MSQTQQAIIGLLIALPSQIDVVADRVNPDWFTGDCKLAYDHISQHGGDMYAISGATGVSVETLNDWVELDTDLFSLKLHLENLEKEAVNRQIKELARILIKSDDIDTAMSAIEGFTNGLGVTEKTKPVEVKKALNDMMEDLQRRYENKGQLLGMTTGLVDLDYKTEGLHKGDLVVIAGASSMGKTAAASGIIEAVCHAGYSGMIFSCEMTTRQLMQRTISSASGVPLGDIRSGRIREADWSRLANATKQVKDYKLIIDDPAGITITELARKVKRQKKHGLDIVMIDYLQIMKYDKSRENMELDSITTSLKSLAKEVDICILLLSQLNRAGQREKRKPAMIDLRGSGMIENNADVIIFPWRPAAECQKCLANTIDSDHDPEVHKREASMIIGKQRQGERNIEIPVVWDERATRFRSASRGYDDLPTF